MAANDWRWYRVSVQFNNFGGQIQCDELVFLDGSTPNTPVAAYASHNNGTAGNFADGNAGTRWESGSFSNPVRLWIDYGTLVPANRMRWDPGSETLQTPRNFTIEVSQDGDTWFDTGFTSGTISSEWGAATGTPGAYLEFEFIPPEFDRGVQKRLSFTID